MIKLSIGFPSKAKPAGSLGRAGNITQNKNKYGPWMKILTRHIQNKCNERLIVPYGVVIHHQVKALNCGDLLNINGAVMDAIKKAGIIKDDSPKYINRFAGGMTKGDQDVITIWICMNQSEFMEALSEIV